MSDQEKYGKHYSDESFWSKLGKYAKDAGKKVVYSGLTLYYALDNPNLPKKAKATIYGALGYLIFPVDAVPDLLPAVGYSDDLGALLLSLGMVAVHINQSTRRKALEKMNDWFGDVTGDKEIREVDSKIIDA